MKRRKKKRGFLLLLAILLFLVAIFMFNRFIGFHHTADLSRGWNLILVNEDNYVPTNYEVEFTQLSNGEQVDSRIYPDLQNMFNDARANGVQLFVRDGYRSKEEQKEIFEEKRKAYNSEGYSNSEAKELAREWVARPGTSEHELGIAVDINAEGSGASTKTLYSWLESNAHKYGFIQRYPPNKTEITGVSHEPWHYRYVGKDVAKIIYENGLSTPTSF